MPTSVCPVQEAMMNYGMMRMMTFHFGSKVPGGLLFSQWRVTTVTDLVGAVVAVFLLAVLYEGLKTLREYLVFMDWRHSNQHTGKVAALKRRSLQQSDSEEEEGRKECNDQSFILASKRQRRTTSRRRKGVKYYSISVSMHLLQSALHVVQVGYAYLLMLVAMTFNGWLFLAISFGAGVGYLLFAKSRHLMGNFREQNEHCHN